MRAWCAGIVFCVVATALSCAGQSAPAPLDPARELAGVAAPAHTPLTEEYIWTAGKTPGDDLSPHSFRVHFRVDRVPAAATLYLAGPRDARVWLNGRLLGHFSTDADEAINFRVFHADAAAALRTGENVLAIEAVRGRGVIALGSEATKQVGTGKVLVAKIVPARFGVDEQPLLISDGNWRAASGQQPADWMDASFADAAWPKVVSLGPVESNVDFFQWSVDAGMYGWPGYMGMSPTLRTVAIPVASVTHVYAGKGSFASLAALTDGRAGGPFSVTYSPAAMDTDADAPSLLLDFGREISGRLLFESASDADALVSIAYGESELEAMSTGLTGGQHSGNYLGTNLLEIPAHGLARGPKSGFRYVRIRFLHGPATMAFQAIRAEGIYYPVTYAGSFDSSDPLLNRIWETGAYTAHLCMQDGIWDAPKRDRGRWVGDLGVEGRTIATAFGDRTAIEATLHALEPSSDSYVNGIPGYSALWVTSLAGLYLRSGDRQFLAAEQDALKRVVAGMDASLDAQGNFRNPGHKWLFVDWAPGLYGLTQDAATGTELQYALAYRAAAELFAALGDKANARRSAAQAEKVLAAAQTRRDANGVTYGYTWQLNALGALLDGATPNPEFWSGVLAHVKQDAPADQAITPYFNATVLDAMTALGHQREALDWIRSYWGGMLAEGATSFWEAYDLRWPKGNPHLSLQADGTSGYFVSLAHGWSSGPTGWLSENVLGITPASAGYETVNIRPRLLGLEYASGSVPTPHGAIRIRVDEKGIELDLPAGIERAHVSYQAPAGNGIVVDGREVRCANCGGAYAVEITTPGHHVIGPRQRP